ncbi:MAG: asparagine--tRNA ligase [Deltaproteobacteria bacterium]|nr:asparagine--tRNA ligase [Deltaproteobacteria bacterium]
MNSALHVYIEDLYNHEGERVTIKGWLYSKRSSGKIAFLIVRDGTGLVQGVLIKGQTDDTALGAYDKVTQESSLIVTGTVRKEPRSVGGYELSIDGIEIVRVAEPYPIAPKEHGTAFLMDQRHLWLRSSRQHAIMRVRAELIRQARAFFDDRGFTLIDAPIFTPSACEGTTTLFETDYFGEKAYLTQSGQLYEEAACMAFGKVYCFGPTFRAERSKTRRHLIEFWMIEPEVAYATLDDVMNLAEAFVEHLVQSALANRRKELELLERDIAKLEKIKAPFPRLSYDEAAERLKTLSPEFKYGSDFGGTDESLLTEQFDKPFFVHRFPATIKAFYMKPDPQNPKLSLSADLLAPEGYGEIIGGGQREDQLDPLLKQLETHGLKRADFEWYLDLRRFGSVPHGGFGLGIERALAWICGLPHVRETIPFPRMLYRLRP